MGKKEAESATWNHPMKTQHSHKSWPSVKFPSFLCLTNLWIFYFTQNSGKFHERHLLSFTVPKINFPQFSMVLSSPGREANYCTSSGGYQLARLKSPVQLKLLKKLDRLVSEVKSQDSHLTTVTTNLNEGRHGGFAERELRWGRERPKEKRCVVHDKTSIVYSPHWWTGHGDFKWRARFHSFRFAPPLNSHFSQLNSVDWKYQLFCSIPLLSYLKKKNVWSPLSIAFLKNVGEFHWYSFHVCKPAFLVNPNTCFI